MKHFCLIVSIFHVAIAMNFSGTNNGAEIYMWCVTMNGAEKIERNSTSLAPELAYIMLQSNEVDGVTTHTISYWIGWEATIHLKKKTVDEVIQLRGYFLHFHVSIFRENVNHESISFKSFFLNRQAEINSWKQTKTRLFKVVYYENKYHIIQVLPNVSEINSKDVFVLVSDSFSIYIMSMHSISGSSSPEKISLYNKKVLAAFRLSNFINETNQARITYLLNKGNYDVNMDPFMYQLGVKNMLHVLYSNFRTQYSWKNVQEKNVLYECKDSMKILNYEIYYSNLIESDACYIFLKLNVNEIFVYVGNSSTLFSLQLALTNAELSMTNNTMLTIFDNTNLPAPFVIVFEDLKNFFFTEGEEMKTIKEVLYSTAE